MKRCLISGISGSIGINFLAYFLAKTDWEIIGIDSFRHRGYSDRLNEVLDGNLEWTKRVTIITHDLAAPFSEFTKKRIGHIDYIIAMASLSDVEASIQEPVPFIQNNINLTLNLLEYAREIKPSVFVQISTDEVYGAVSSKHDDLRVEWDAIIPSNPYAASKACQEAIAISYWRTYGVPVIIMNFMNNWGIMQSPAKFPVIAQKKILANETIQIHGNDKGEIGSRSYIDSRDCADAVLFILEKSLPYLHQEEQADRPDRYNIAGDVQLDNLELAKEIASLMGKELKYEIVNFHKARSGHDPHYGLDMTKMRKLGWKAPLGWKKSLKDVVEWQQAHPKWIT